MAEVLGQAAAPQGPAPDHPDQRRRPRRAGHRRADHQRRRTGRSLAGDDGRASTSSCPPPGATTTRSTSSAMPAPSATPRRSKIAAAGSQQRRPAGHPHPAGHDRPHRDRRGARSRTPRSLRQAGAGQLDGRRGRCRGRGDPQQGRHPHLPLSRHGRAQSSPTCGSYTDNLRSALRDAHACRRRTTARAGPREGRARSSTTCAQDGPHHPDRGRVQAAAGRLRHPDRRDPDRHRAEDEAVQAGRRRSASRSCSSSTPRPSPTRPTSAACS